MSNYTRYLCIHPIDKTTDFLLPVGKIFGDDYHRIDTKGFDLIKFLENLEEGKKLIIFLGHGTRSYLCASEPNQRDVFINVENGVQIFKNNDIVIVSCYSSTFLDKINSFNNGIGFGNIISSIEERNAEAESITSIYRNLSEKDIELSNLSFTNSLTKTFNLLLNKKIEFYQFKDYLTFYLNQEIGTILSIKEKENRKEIAKLLFEIRNELEFLTN